MDGAVEGGNGGTYIKAFQHFPPILITYSSLQHTPMRFDGISSPSSRSRNSFMTHHGSMLRCHVTCWSAVTLLFTSDTRHLTFVIGLLLVL